MNGIICHCTSNSAISLSDKTMIKIGPSYYYLRCIADPYCFEALKLSFRQIVNQSSIYTISDSFNTGRVAKSPAE